VLKVIFGPKRDEVIYVGFEVIITVVKKNTISWDITSCILFRRFGRTYHFHLQGSLNRAKYQREIKYTLGTCLAYSVLKMEAIGFSETPVDFQRTTLRYIKIFKVGENSIMRRFTTCILHQI
jgi:hypothetical protein